MVGLFKAEMARAQLVHQLEDTATTACDAGERVVRYHDGQAGLLRKELVDVAQERATTCEDDAAFRDIRS
jgi:hypothetical protein